MTGSAEGSVGQRICGRVCSSVEGSVVLRRRFVVCGGVLGSAEGSVGLWRGLQVYGGVCGSVDLWRGLRVCRGGCESREGSSWSVLALPMLTLSSLMVRQQPSSQAP